MKTIQYILAAIVILGLTAARAGNDKPATRSAPERRSVPLSEYFPVLAPVAPAAASFSDGVPAAPVTPQDFSPVIPKTATFESLFDLVEAERIANMEKSLSPMVPKEAGFSDDPSRTLSPVIPVYADFCDTIF